MRIFAFQFPSRCWRPPTPAAANAAPNAAVNAAPNAAANVAIVTRNREYCKFHNQVFSLFVLIFLTVKVLVTRQSLCRPWYSPVIIISIRIFTYLPAC